MGLTDKINKVCSGAALSSLALFGASKGASAAGIELYCPTSNIEPNKTYTIYVKAENTGLNNQSTDGVQWNLKWGTPPTPPYTNPSFIQFTDVFKPSADLIKEGFV